MSAKRTLPSNVHVSNHPCVRVKLSKLRSSSTSPRDVSSLVHDIAMLVGAEALADLEVCENGQDFSPLGYPFASETLSPIPMTLVPILRSGLAMVPALTSLLPDLVPVHHLGLSRNELMMPPFEYYNNFKGTGESSTDEEDDSNSDPWPPKLAIVVDPIVATGQTAYAAIETLKKEWKATKIIMVGILGSLEGLEKASKAGGNKTSVSIWVGGVDDGLDEKKMIKPGLGDIGDRLFLTIGKQPTPQALGVRKHVEPRAR